MPNIDNTTPHSSSAYDQQIRATIPYYDNFHRETINLVRAAVPEPESWLDTGCGTGSLIQSAVSAFPVTTFYLADPSPEMLAEAKKKLLPQYGSRVRFLEAAPTQNLISSENPTFDVVTAIQAHHYLDEAGRENATRNVFNLLKPGGLYVTFENIRPATEEGIAIGKSNWGNFQQAAGKSPEAVINHLQRFGVEYLPITVEAHLRLLREAGFKTVEIFWLSYMQAGFYGVK
jgi:tRNA (cmo5U34)-methyltransferase